MSPEWEPLRNKCLRCSRNVDPYSFRLLTALASLPTLVRDVRHALSDGPLDPTSDLVRILLLKARLFKTEVAQQAHELNVDGTDFPVITTILTFEDPLSEKEEVFTFRDQRTALRFHLYWASTIIANTILMRLGVDDPALSAETREAARRISSSTGFIRSFKPFGVLWTTMTVSMAFGVSPPAQQAFLMREIVALFEQLPMRVGSLSMQIAFDSMTGGPVRLYPND